MGDTVYHFSTFLLYSHTVGPFALCLQPSTFAYLGVMYFAMDALMEAVHLPALIVALCAVQSYMSPACLVLLPAGCLPVSECLYVAQPL